MDISYRLTVLFLLMVFTTVSPGVLADDLDPASQEALKKTQTLLNNSQERQKAIDQDSKAAFIDQQVKSLGGTQQNADEIYALSADILGTLAKEANGDPTKMLELLERAKRDPNSFGDKLTPEQKAKLKSISQRIPAGTQQPTVVK